MNAVAGQLDVAVVGAGIVGVCIAYELRKRGVNVMLIDRNEPGAGCSFGNSGAISQSSITPLAMPGVLASVPRMLCVPDSPLYLPLSYLPRAMPWLARFVASATPERVAASVERLGALHADAVVLHQALAREVGVPELILQRGHLHLYPDGTALEKDATAWRIRAEHGTRCERLDRAGVVALEPRISPRYRVGMFLPDHATVVNPHRYVRSILRRLLECDGHLLQADVSALTPHSAGGWRLETTAGALTVPHVVVAAGAWSRRLLDPLEVCLPLETQRGYHVQFSEADMPVSRTVVLADRKVFVTPMETGLRVGGTVEIGGLEHAPNTRRSELLAKIARETFQDAKLGQCSHWMGHRPCMPDSVPVIGPVSAHRGLWLAVGHGHLGLTGAPRTALRIADGLLGGAFDLAPREQASAV